jgi:hypothetical protein
MSQEQQIWQKTCITHNIQYRPAGGSPADNLMPSYVQVSNNACLARGKRTEGFSVEFLQAATAFHGNFYLRRLLVGHNTTFEGF